jgi:hypothetical protein
MPLMRHAQRDEIGMIDAELLRDAVNLALLGGGDCFVCC